MALQDELNKLGLNDEELKIIDGFTVNENSSLFDLYSQATINGKASIANKIAALNVDLQDGKYGWSLAHIAIRNDCMEAFDYLLENEADLEVMDGVGWNPLMESVVDDKVEFAKKLVARGVDTAISNQRGATAGALIQKFGRSDFFGLI